MSSPQMTREQIDDLDIQDGKASGKERRGMIGFILGMPVILFLTALAMVAVIVFRLFK